MQSWDDCLAPLAVRDVSTKSLFHSCTSLQSHWWMKWVCIIFLFCSTANPAGGDCIFHLMQHYHPPLLLLLPFCPSLKTFGFPLEGQCWWSRNCQWKMSWCVSWKGAKKCHPHTEQEIAFLVKISQNVRKLQGEIFKPHAAKALEIYIHIHMWLKKVRIHHKSCTNPHPSVRRWRSAPCISASVQK